MEDELQELPRTRREEIITEVEAHIRDARTANAAETDADLLNLLDRLGDPSVIGAEARERFDIREPQEAGARDVIALLLLTVGALVIPIVTGILGALLVRSSASWSAREKRNSLVWALIVTVGLPLILTVIFSLTARIAGWNLAVALPGVALFVLLVGVVTPVLSGLLLAAALARRRPQRRNRTSSG
jgi:hypothetical protein